MKSASSPRPVCARSYKNHSILNMPALPIHARPLRHCEPFAASTLRLFDKLRAGEAQGGRSSGQAKARQSIPEPSPASLPPPLGEGRGRGSPAPSVIASEARQSIPKPAPSSLPESLPLPLGEGRGEGLPESESAPIPTFSVISNPEFLKEGAAV